MAGWIKDLTGTFYVWNYSLVTLISFFCRRWNVIVGSHSSLLSSVEMETGIGNWTINLGDRIESGCCINKSCTLGFVGCYDHFVYCLSLLDGKIIWKYKTGDMIKSTPCLSTKEETVFVASYDTYLHCLSCFVSMFSVLQIIL